MTHELKCWPEYFQALKSKEKNFEVRKNDRNFQVGDELIIHEYSPLSDQHSGASIVRQVTYILHGGVMGIEEGYCVMSII